jgi:hypothetical protein
VYTPIIFKIFLHKKKFRKKKKICWKLETFLQIIKFDIKVAKVLLQKRKVQTFCHNVTILHLMIDFQKSFSRLGVMWYPSRDIKMQVFSPETFWYTFFCKFVQKLRKISWIYTRKTKRKSPFFWLRKMTKFVRHRNIHLMGHFASHDSHSG